MGTIKIGIGTRAARVCMFELIWHWEGRTKTKTEKHSSAFLRARRIWGDGVYFALFCVRMLIGSYASSLIFVFIYLLTCLPCWELEGVETYCSVKYRSESTKVFAISETSNSTIRSFEIPFVYAKVCSNVYLTGTSMLTIHGRCWYFRLVRCGSMRQGYSDTALSVARARLNIQGSLIPP